MIPKGPRNYHIGYDHSFNPVNNATVRAMDDLNQQG